MLMKSQGTLIPQAYDLGFTNLKYWLNQYDASQAGQPRTGPVRSTPVPFALVGGAPAIVIAAQNEHRTGMLIQNKDPTNDLFVGIGSLADENSLSIAPRGYVLFDFTTPTDTISVFALVDVRGYLLEMAPTT